MSNMVRREVIMLLGSAATWPLAAHAQKSDQVRRVGVIMGFAENDEVWQAYLANFRQGLQEFGWTDGRNIRFDYRFTGDSEELMRSMAEEVAGLQPDVILVSTNSVVSATLKATRSIPIVFTWVSDPVGSGFVANLPHPGGNITGFHNFEPAIGGKWLAFLKQIAPDMRRVAVVHVPRDRAERRVPPRGRGCSPFIGRVCDSGRDSQCRRYRARVVGLRRGKRRPHRDTERADGDAARSHHRTGSPAPLACDLFVRFLCRERGPNVLWDQSARAGAVGGVLR